MPARTSRPAETVTARARPCTDRVVREHRDERHAAAVRSCGRRERGVLRRALGKVGIPAHLRRRLPCGRPVSGGRQDGRPRIRRPEPRGRQARVERRADNAPVTAVRPHRRRLRYGHGVPGDPGARVHDHLRPRHAQVVYHDRLPRRDDGLSGLACSATRLPAIYCLAGTDGPDVVVNGSSGGWSAPPGHSAEDRAYRGGCLRATATPSAWRSRTATTSCQRRIITPSTPDDKLTAHSMLAGSYRYARVLVTHQLLRGVEDPGAALERLGVVDRVDLAERHETVTDIACLAGNPACLAVTAGDHAFLRSTARRPAPRSP